MPECPYRDPFKEARRKSPVLETEFDGEPVAMLVGHKAVRTAARDHATFSSDAPFRVPIPREEDVRTVRQYPLEVDPPAHAEYRRIIDSFFRRPLEPAYVQRIENLIEELLVDALKRDSIEIVRQFAIPLQSRALTYLLNMPESEAEIWITWGTHVFRDESGVSKGAEMEAYTNSLFDQAESDPGDDFFSALVKARFDGRPLTREEMQGYANIAFAGGRDTIINSVATAFGLLADQPSALIAMRANPKLIITASEELFRFASPVTHLARICPVDTSVHGVDVPAGNLVSLNWAAANFDDSVFDDPEQFQIDRKPNPHIAFGKGVHNCPGAAHARVIIRGLFKKLTEMISAITIVSERRKVEKEADYERVNAYHELTVKLESSASSPDCK